MSTKFPLSLLLSVCSLCGIAQTYKAPVFTVENRAAKIAATFPALDRLYKEYAEKNHFPGMVYGILVDGKLVHTGATGYTDIEHHIPASASSDFRIASMTKSFTAMAIMKLRDEGKLRLDDPAGLYIPEMKGIKYLTTDASPITIRQLLSHAAGFPEDNPWGDRQLAATNEELLNIYKKGVSFSNAPGLGYEYSNLGFATLGYLIKKITGMPYQRYITEHILKPLGMTNTYWEYSAVPENQLAHGYRWVNHSWVEQPLLHDGSYGAMGGLITSIEDFSKYMAVHLTAWPPRDGQDSGPVKRSSVREMQYPWNISTLSNIAQAGSGKLCPVVNAYAYGLRWSKDCENRIYVGHTGGLPGFGSQWNIMPDYGVGVVAFANLTYARAGVINAQVLDTLLQLSGISPRQLPASAILKQRKEELSRLLPEWKNAEKSGIFAMNFFMDYSIEDLKGQCAGIFEKAGKITGIQELVAENQLRGYFIMEGTKANIRVSFTLTPEHPALIQEYHLELRSK